MKDEIRILFFKNVGHYLDGEDLKYIIIKNKEENYTVKDNVPKFNGFISALADYLCYDYDELSIYNQKRYEKFYIQLKRVNDNIYSIQTKTYSIKRQSLT